MNCTTQRFDYSLFEKKLKKNEFVKSIERHTIDTYKITFVDDLFLFVCVISDVKPVFSTRLPLEYANQYWYMIDDLIFVSHEELYDEIDRMCKPASRNSHSRGRYLHMHY